MKSSYSEKSFNASAVPPIAADSTQNNPSFISGRSSRALGAINIMAFIYALKDPETRRIRYIGKAECLKKRLACHLVDRCRCHRTNWISSLKSRGLRPEMETLLIVPDAEWAKWEIKFIAQARAMGMDLTNETIGGDGPWSGRKQPPEMIAKRVAKLTGRPSKLRGRPLSPEHRAAISVALKGVPKTPEHNAKVAAASRGKIMSPEACRKNGEAHLRKNLSAETIEKKRAAALRFWEKKRNAV